MVSKYYTIGSQSPTQESRDLVCGCSDEMCSTSVLPSGVNLWGAH